MIFQVHSPSEIPNVIAVRGINRHVGTTSIVANLALTLAQRGAKTLLLDLNLWNCDLARSFGFEPTSALIDLARRLDDGEILSSESVESHIKSCRPNLDLLPGTLHWIKSDSLRGENGWSFIHEVFVRAYERWENVLVDLGSHVSDESRRETTFLIPTAVHASILQASTFIVGVCDSIEYLYSWQASPNQDTNFQDKTIYVVNGHRSDLPFGLDKFKLDQNMRAQSYLIPTLDDGLLPNRDGLFFVERASNIDKPSRGEKIALRAIQDIANCVSHVPA